MQSTLIETDELEKLLMQGSVVILDCRFDVSRPEVGATAWRSGHIPNAHYVDLDVDMAAPASDTSGRHPLPEPEIFQARLESYGITPTSQVVVYDDAGGAIAGRMWWLLRWIGHEAVSVLNGGWPKWIQENRPVSTEVPTSAASHYPITPDRSLWLSTEQVEAQLEQQNIQLLDARDPARFAGDVEPLDTKAGHIPGAQNMPFRANLNDDGTFLSTEALRERFQAIADHPQPVCHSCGSGVTACHNLLAMAYAGLEPGQLYVGSWSEWIRNPRRPIETGNAPSD